MARGGAQERERVMPDLTTLGKVIGGGLPVGAFGGRADMMAHLSPDGPVYQAGTLSGNPVAMAAGIATLQVVRDDATLLRAPRSARQTAGRGLARGHQQTRHSPLLHLRRVDVLDASSRPGR